MSLTACIAKLKKDGLLGDEESAYVERLYDKLRKRMEKQMGPAAAEAMASDQALDLAVASLTHKRRQAVLQVAAQRGVLDDLGRYRAEGHARDFGKAAEGILVRGERASAYSNAELKTREIYQTTMGRLFALAERHGYNLVGKVRDQAGLLDVLRELYGVDSGNGNAKTIARAWSEAVEELRLRANAAGAGIIRLEGWRLPQSHDSLKVRNAAGGGDDMNAAFAAWREAELPRLDREAMLDRETGQPLDDDALDAVLRHSFDSIVTDGWAHREEGAGGAPSVANRMSQTRVLVYKDAESWLASQMQFGGTGGIYDAMMGHVHSMARDIALMERLGPNPAATLRWLKDVVVAKAANEKGAGSKADEAAHASANTIQQYYDTLSGANRRPQSRRLALLGSTLRQWQVTTKLGSAVLSTTSDFATGVLTRAYNGLPMTGIVSGYARYLNPASAEHRALAARAGFIAEQAGSAISGTGRMMAEEMGHEVVSRLAAGTLRASGLDAVTEAGRQSFGMELFAHISHERSKAYEALDPKFRGMFERYGFGREGWDALRATEVEHLGGADWILPERIADKKLGRRLLEMAYQEMDVAVPTSGVATRAMLDSVAPKGTWRGEAIRTLFQFKAFPITLMMTQWQRAMAQDSNFDRLVAFGLFFGASTLAGAFALQMKEIAKGRDARPMGSAAFFLEAAAQGGGAGLYGDFVRSTESRFGGGPLQVISGPGIETLSSLGTLTVGNAQRALKGEDTHFARDAVNLAKGNTPIAGSLWYTRVALERGLFDKLRHAADPMAGAADARMERKYQRDYGQSHWWAPGDGAPASAPDLMDAFNVPPKD